GELPEETVLREVSEETGLTVEIIGERRAPDPANGKVRYLLSPRHIQLEDIPGPGGFHQHIDLIYFCRPLSGSVRLAPEDHEEIHWFSEADLIENSLGETLPDEVRATGALAIRALTT
ncbi:MAG: NUDIX hydrolase, partial [Elusimicrobiota bacterium]